MFLQFTRHSLEPEKVQDRVLKPPSHTAMGSGGLTLLGVRFSAQRAHEKGTGKPTVCMVLTSSFFTLTHTGSGSYPDFSLIGSKKSFLDRPPGVGEGNDTQVEQDGGRTAGS